MKLKLNAIVLCLLCCQGATFPAAAQGTAFTYQGRLSNGASSANGSFDLTFALFNASSGGSQTGTTITNAGLSVTNGLFTVVLDFGTVFNGTAYWLELGVRTNGASIFTILSPRQPVTPAPYAVFAEGANAAGLSGTIPAGDLGGTYGNAVIFNNPLNQFSGNGSGLTGVNASTVDGLGASQFWHLGGNAGTTPGLNFLGTVDNQRLELQSFGQRGLELQYITQTNTVLFYSIAYAMNVIGGYWGNTVANGAVGATIAGGGELFQLVGLPGTSYPNVVTGNLGTIGGGYNNTAGPVATIPGGSDNIATGAGSFAAGRYAQTTNSGNFVWSDGSRTFAGSAVDAFDVLASGGVNFNTGVSGVTVDYLNGNNGSIYYGLRFGANSGEGIASKRTAGGDQYGLDFYTSWANRMTIANNGYVGIGTTTPQAMLEVNGESVQVDGAAGEQAFLAGAFGNVYVGSLNAAVTHVSFLNFGTLQPMHIDCSSITIEGGADLAEPFTIASPAGQIPAGAVLVIDAEHPGQLTLSDRPYDTRVAGVVSGANGINPGIQLRQKGVLEGGQNVALTGRVYVRATAVNGPIVPGDLLTTSETAGCAMRVGDHARAQGAILGKAMTGLQDGTGMVLVLVTLQ